MIPSPSGICVAGDFGAILMTNTAADGRLVVHIIYFTVQADRVALNFVRSYNQTRFNILKMAEIRSVLCRGWLPNEKSNIHTYKK